MHTCTYLRDVQMYTARVSTLFHSLKKKKKLPFLSESKQVTR